VGSGGEGVLERAWLAARLPSMRGVGVVAPEAEVFEMLSLATREESFKKMQEVLEHVTGGRVMYYSIGLYVGFAVPVYDLNSRCVEFIVIEALEECVYDPTSELCDDEDPVWKIYKLVPPKLDPEEARYDEDTYFYKYLAVKFAKRDGLVKPWAIIY